MTDSNKFHIILSIPESTPKTLSEKILEDIDDQNLNIHVEKSSFGQVSASLEWFIPTALGIFLLKPYFESFLKSAGQDHYNILKEWLIKQMQMARLIKVTTITSSTSPNKLLPNNTQSKSASLQFELKTKQKLNLLFDETLSNDEWASAIHKMADRVKNHYDNFPNDELTNSIFDSNLQGEFLWGILNNERKEWTLLDKVKIRALTQELRKKDD